MKLQKPATLHNASHRFETRSRNILLVSFRDSMFLLNRRPVLSATRPHPASSSASMQTLSGGQESRQIRGTTEGNAGPRLRTSCLLGRGATGLVRELMWLGPPLCMALYAIGTGFLKVLKLRAPKSDACTQLSMSLVRSHPSHIGRYLSGTSV